MKKIYTLITACCITSFTFAQLAINTLGTPVTIDFSGFAGAGFQPGGGGGTLNSDEWSAIGFSDGDVAFGAIATTGDFARGSTTGLETTGGIYGVDIMGNQGLMVQPVADDFTPGSFILKVVNNTASTIGQIDLAYTIYVLNDQNRANSFNFSYSYDNVTYSPVGALDYTSPEAMDLTPYISLKSTSLTGLSINSGAVFYLSWTGNDVSGAGNRDEFALDDISITASVGAGTDPLYSISTPDLTVNEGDLEFSFDVQLSESHDCTIHFGYIAGGTATPGFDYGLTGFTLDFTAGGPTSQTVIAGLVDDVIAEGTEYGGITITSADGGCIAGPDVNLNVTIEDNELVTPPIATFTTVGVTDDEAAGTVSGTISLTEAADCELQMTLDGATTMTAGADYTFALPHNFTFTAAGVTTQSFDIPIIDDVTAEPSEMLLMNLNVISGTCVLGAIADFEINISDNDGTPPIYTPHTIAEVSGEGVDGVAGSLGEMVDLTGIVYGINIWDGGLQFTLIDNTGGISVFNFDHTFGYTVTEGDQVNILGTIDQFNGLTEIIADTLIYVDGGNTLKTPTAAASLNEATESDLISMNLDGYWFTDATQWLGDGTSFNVDVTNGTNTITMRIDNNTEMASMAFNVAFPFGATGMIPDVFILKGIGGQYDAASPYTEGYEIFPRYLSDIDAEFGDAVNDLQAINITVFPNPAADHIQLSGTEIMQSVTIMDQTGRVVKNKAISGLDVTVDISDLASGIYLIKLNSEKGVYATSFMKQ